MTSEQNAHARPDTVQILGMTYPVRTEPNEHFVNNANGKIDGDAQYILIADALGPDKDRETLLHEVIHGISFAMCSDLTEHQVRSMANGLYAVLRNNPALVTYLTALNEGNK